jgi:hypothetical protein
MKSSVGGVVRKYLSVPALKRRYIRLGRMSQAFSYKVIYSCPPLKRLADLRIGGPF